MKKLVLLYALIFSVSHVFISCRDNNSEREGEELIEEGTRTEEFGEENETDFSNYDRDGDGLWSEEEFGESYGSDLAVWDEDKDKTLNEDEFYNSLYADTDRNKDEKIDEKEWKEGRNSYGDYAQEEDFASFDADEDGFLNSEEWNEVFANSEWFSDFDKNEDNQIAEEEWNAGVFDKWDKNDDDQWDEREYADYAAYIGNQ